MRVVCRRRWGRGAAIPGPTVIEIPLTATTLPNHRDAASRARTLIRRQLPIAPDEGAHAGEREKAEEAAAYAHCIAVLVGGVRADPVGPRGDQSAIRANRGEEPGHLADVGVALLVRDSPMAATIPSPRRRTAMVPDRESRRVDTDAMSPGDPGDRGGEEEDEDDGDACRGSASVRSNSPSRATA